MPGMKKSSGGMTVNFDKYNPNSEKGTDVRGSLAGLDYSPLKRVSGRSFAMAMLVSMGGLMYGFSTSPFVNPLTKVLTALVTTQVRFLAFLRCLTFFNDSVSGKQTAHMLLAMFVLV